MCVVSPGIIVSTVRCLYRGAKESVMISLVLGGINILLCMWILIELIEQAVECTCYLEGFRILFYLTLVGVLLGISASQFESAI